MRVVLTGFAVVLAALVSLSAGGAAWANGGTRVFQVSCLPEIDQFEIRRLGYVAEPRGLVTGTTYDLTGKGYALYSPEWAYYQLDKRSDKVVDEAGTLFATRFECRLKSEAIALIVLPVLSGRYGVSDIAVTFGIGGRWVVEDVPFQPCDDRGPITRLVYDGNRKILSLEGRFGGIWPERVTATDIEQNSRREYNFDDKALKIWDIVSRGWKVLSGPLTSKDIDYFVASTSEYRDTLVEDCYGLGSDVRTDMQAQ